jgi:hypothetical protein
MLLFRSSDTENEQILSFYNRKIEGFHYRICEQFFAGFARYVFGCLLALRLYVQVYLLAYTHIIDAGQAQIVEAGIYSFSLWIQQFFEWHYVYVCYVFHKK